MVGIAEAELVDDAQALTLEIETADWARRIEEIADEIAIEHMIAVAACPGIAYERADSSVEN